MLFSACNYFHTTRYGKYKIAEKSIKSLNIKQDSQVLDLGTGHGMMMIDVAKYLKAPGKVTGIDIWSNKDQSNNSITETSKNIKKYEDVASLMTANMLDLPFPNNSFDIVTASFAIHNLKTKEQRNKALKEAFRVLKPGGKLLIIDLLFGYEYKKDLLKLNKNNDISIKNAGYDGWWGGPWMSTTILTLTKK